MSFSKALIFLSVICYPFINVLNPSSLDCLLWFKYAVYQLCVNKIIVQEISSFCVQPCGCLNIWYVSNVFQNFILILFFFHSMMKV